MEDIKQPEGIECLHFDVKDAFRIKDNFAKYKNVKSTLIKGNDSYISKFTICIPTYKRVKTLRDTIESCINQVEFEDYVIIVCDNNPEREDETEQYITSLDDKRLLYYKHEKNIGMYGNLNRLYELSKSEYTVCIHDDDILFPHFLQITNNITTKYDNIDVLFPRKTRWKENDSMPRPQESIYRKKTIRKVTLYDMLMGNEFPPTGFIAKTSKILEIGGFDEIFYPSSDYYFNVKAIKNLNVYELSQPLYLYRWSINTTLKLETLLGFLEMDIPLMREVASSNYILSFFKEYFISKHCRFYIETIAKLYPKCNLKVLPYGTKNWDSLMYRVYNKLMSFFWSVVFKFSQLRTL